MFELNLNGAVASLSSLGKLKKILRGLKKRQKISNGDDEGFTPAPHFCGAFDFIIFIINFVCSGIPRF